MFSVFKESSSEGPMTVVLVVKPAALDCPSAATSSQDAEIFGVVGGSVDAPRVHYLEKPVPVTTELLENLGEARAGEVLRIRGRCAQGGCVHYADHCCTLGRKIAELPHQGPAKLPPCAIRSTCRWFAEQGKSACQRCPSIVTEIVAPAERIDKRIRLVVFKQLDHAKEHEE
jgi:hypothetical protein